MSDIRELKNLTHGQTDAVLLKIGDQTGLGLAEGAQAFLRDEYEIVRKARKLLELMGTVKVNISKKFILGKYLFDNPGKIKLYYLGDNFKEWFMAGASKQEEPVGEQELLNTKLTEKSFDVQIIEELGGKAKAETTLSEMFAQIEKQPNGQEGALLTNGYANIFYCRDTGDVLRAVCVFWRTYGWYVRADSVGYPSARIAGDQVFSRNS